MEIAIIVLIIIGFIALYLALRQLVTSKSQQELQSVVDTVFGMSAQKISEQSRDILSSEKEKIDQSLDHKQRALEVLLKQLQEDLHKRQMEIRTYDKERTKKFAEIVESLQHHRESTKELTTITKNLEKVLSNNQQRGGWGERIIEDLLQSNGLVEGIHYARQQKLAGSTLRPDITLLLPNERVVPVDVKFPYSEIQKYSEATSKQLKDAHLKQFSRDVQQKISKVAEYIDPSHNTLDYSVLFVPNEMVFSFINQKFPELVDVALNKRVLLVSPFTFLIVARTVMESYRNFMIGDKLKSIIKTIDEFSAEWKKMKTQLEKYGKHVDQLQNSYQELAGTRMRQMDRKIAKVDTVSSGGMLQSHS